MVARNAELPPPSSDIALTITRVFDAPRELVFRAWTEPEHMMRWLCPTGFSVLFAEADPRPGGRWRSGMRDPEGNDYVHHGVYSVVEPPARLVLSHTWAKNHLEPVADTVITVTLTERDGKTTMVFHQVGFGTTASSASHRGGWSGAFDSLAQLLANPPRTPAMIEPIPTGFEGLIPHLTCGDASAAIDFYKNAFGAQEISRVVSPDGKRIMHAEMRLDGRPLFLNDDFPDMCGGKPGTPIALGGSPVTIHRYVRDCDAAVRRAVDAGAVVRMPPMDMFWGDRYALIVDPFGHCWSLATHQRDLTPQQIEDGMKQAFCQPQ